MANQYYIRLFIGKGPGGRKWYNHMEEIKGVPNNLAQTRRLAMHLIRYYDCDNAARIYSRMHRPGEPEDDYENVVGVVTRYPGNKFTWAHQVGNGIQEDHLNKNGTIGAAWIRV